MVREIRTTDCGTYYAIVNLGKVDKTGVRISLPAAGTTCTDAATADVLDTIGGVVTLDFYPFELKAVHVSVD